MNLDDFFEISRTQKEIERRNRIRLSIAAYAYEFESDSIISDGDFDALALQINPELSTIEDNHSQIQQERYKVLDNFFKEEFQPDTGQWIHKHPELDKVAFTYNKYYKKRNSDVLPS